MSKLSTHRLSCLLMLIAFGGSISRPVAAQDRLALEAPDWSLDEEAGHNHAWRFWGGNLRNSHSSQSEHRIGPNNAARLAKKWTFTTGGDVSATPTVEEGALYVPDWAGNLFKINAETGVAIWSKKISDFTGIPTSYSRNSPAIAGDRIIIGDQASSAVMAIDKYTGALLWKTSADPHPAAIITSSPVVFHDHVYVGVSSREEGLALIPGFSLSFRGSIRALNLGTGEVVWTTYTVPEGYTGGSVWGGNFAVDTRRGSLYVTTGNNYSVPGSVSFCLQGAADIESQLACLSPDDYVDSVLSLGLEDGQVKWSRRLQGADTFTLSCVVKPNQGIPCPDPSGPDYDFGSGPNLFTVRKDHHSTDLVGAGQKSGVYWALDADTGAVVWATQVGPGGLFGGIQWGSATDGRRIYVAIGNTGHASYTLAPSHITTVNAGSWAALDPATGAILWQTAATGADPNHPDLKAPALGQMSAANGVVYAGSMSGDMVALDARNGGILWGYASGGSVVCGPSILNGTVFWGSGYTRLKLGTPNNKVYAFALEHEDFRDGPGER